MHIIVLILFPVTCCNKVGVARAMLAHVYLLWYYLGKKQEE